MKLELYYFEECPYCQIVLNTIKNQNLKEFIQFRNTRQDPQHREKLMKDTGRGTVPCLYIDNQPMHESKDISNWLINNSQKIKQG